MHLKFHLYISITVFVSLHSRYWHWTWIVNFSFCTCCLCVCSLFLASVTSLILELKATLTLLYCDHMLLAQFCNVDLILRIYGTHLENYYPWFCVSTTKGRSRRPLRGNKCLDQCLGFSVYLSFSLSLSVCLFFCLASKKHFCHSPSKQSLEIWSALSLQPMASLGSEPFGGGSFSVGSHDVLLAELGPWSRDGDGVIDGLDSWLITDSSRAVTHLMHSVGKNMDISY